MFGYTRAIKINKFGSLGQLRLISLVTKAELTCEAFNQKVEIGEFPIVGYCCNPPSVSLMISCRSMVTLETQV